MFANAVDIHERSPLYSTDGGLLYRNYGHALIEVKRPFDALEAFKVVQPSFSGALVVGRESGADELITFPTPWLFPQKCAATQSSHASACKGFVGQIEAQIPEGLKR